MRVALAILLVCLCPGCLPERSEAGGDDVVFVSDVLAGEVHRIELSSGHHERWLVDDSLPSEAGAYGFAPAALASWGDALLVSNFLTGEVVALGPDGELEQVVLRPDRELPPMEEPVGLAWAGDRLAVLGNDTRNVVLLHPHDSTTAASLTEVPIRNGHALVSLGDQLVVATSPHDRATGLLQRFDRRTGERLGTFAPYGELQEATHVALGPDGWLYVTDWFAGSVWRYDPDTGAQLDLVVGGLDRPVSVAFRSTGELLVLEAERLWSPAADHVWLDGLQMGRGLLRR